MEKPGSAQPHAQKGEGRQKKWSSETQSKALPLSENSAAHLHHAENELQEEKSALEDFSAKVFAFSSKNPISICQQFATQWTSILDRALSRFAY